MKLVSTILALTLSTLLFATAFAQDTPITPALVQSGQTIPIKAGTENYFQYTIIPGQIFFYASVVMASQDFNFTLTIQNQNPATDAALLKPVGVRYFKINVKSSDGINVPVYNASFRYKYNSDNAIAGVKESTIRYGILDTNTNSYVTFQDPQYETNADTNNISQNCDSLQDLAAFDITFGLFGQAGTDSGNPGTPGTPGNPTNGSSGLISSISVIILFVLVVVQQFL